MSASDVLATHSVTIEAGTYALADPAAGVTAALVWRGRCEAPPLRPVTPGQRR